MKPTISFLSALTVVSLSPGCMTHTIISRPSFYPTHLKAYESAQAQFSVYVSAHGASGRSYVDRTEKTVYISFAKRGVTKTKTKLILVAADLEWDVRWPRAGAPHIAFYDLPDGVSSYDDNAKALQRVILTKRYRFDPKADAFIEYPGASSLQNFDR